MQQLTLDLYQSARRRATGGPEGTAAWLRDVHGCTHPMALEYAKALFQRFGQRQASERCKCITLVDGRHAVEGWTWWDLEEVIGIFRENDYHTCWDRCWAARQGWPRDKVKRLEVFAYGNGEHTWR